MKEDVKNPELVAMNSERQNYTHQGLQSESTGHSIIQKSIENINIQNKNQHLSLQQSQ